MQYRGRLDSTERVAPSGDDRVVDSTHTFFLGEQRAETVGGQQCSPDGRVVTATMAVMIPPTTVGVEVQNCQTRRNRVKLLAWSIFLHRQQPLVGQPALICACLPTLHCIAPGREVQSKDRTRRNSLSIFSASVVEYCTCSLHYFNLINYARTIPVVPMSPLVSTGLAAPPPAFLSVGQWSIARICSHLNEFKTI